MRLEEGIVQEHLGLHKAAIPATARIVFIRFASGREIRSVRYDDERRCGRLDEGFQ